VTQHNFLGRFDMSARRPSGSARIPGSMRSGHASVGPASRLRDLVTRLIDVSVAAVALIVTAPLMVVILVLTRVTSPGPAFFTQSRIGHRQRPFKMLKIRTMYVDCDDRVHRDFVRRMLRGGDPRPGSSGGLFKLANDPRITPLGRILRMTSLDELPQFVNVLLGHMALVGPRPALTWEVELYQPHHHERFLVKPGITGLWQVSGRSRLTMNEALELDVRYVRSRTVALDLWILVRTIPAVLNPGSAR
jgi:lipopolysaccharide/colanic/teichoic acid biosynthesis glycosyltransferase